MDTVFKEMFTNQAEKIINGDYFYHIQWYADMITEFRTKMAKERGLSLEKFLERKQSGIALNFKQHWLKTTFQVELSPFDYHWTELFTGENKDIKIEMLIEKIAFESRHFMDIASSEHMGFAPYMLKINPNIPCLLTDIDSHTMKCLRICIDEHLPSPEYNISIASFDNFKIPMKDDSLDCVTSLFGITSSGESLAVMTPCQFSANKKKLINEIYRVIKPGGYLITIENIFEFDYDLQKIYDDYGKNGKLFEIYTYDEIQAVLELMVESSWCDKFMSAGFHVEAEKRQHRNYSIHEINEFLLNFTSIKKIREWTEEEKQSIKINDGAKKYDTNDIGIYLYDVDALYILRKPN